MPYFELQKEDTGFPPAHFADGEGLLAVGGSMSPSLLLKAYSQGIFYWHHPMKHIRWWSPDPRIVADPVSLANAEAPELPFEFRGSANPERLLRFFQKIYNHKEQMGPSWLSERMFRIFMHLHQCGITLGLEVFLDGALVGGYFGICMGEMCYGEYAGATVAGADTAAISEAARLLTTRGVRLMDMHKPTARDEVHAYEEWSRLAYVDQCKANAEKYSDLIKSMVV